MFTLVHQLSALKSMDAAKIICSCWESDDGEVWCRETPHVFAGKAPRVASLLITTQCSSVYFTTSQNYVKFDTFWGGKRFTFAKQKFGDQLVSLVFRCSKTQHLMLKPRRPLAFLPYFGQIFAMCRLLDSEVLFHCSAHFYSMLSSENLRTIMLNNTVQSFHDNCLEKGEKSG